MNPFLISPGKSNFSPIHLVVCSTLCNPMDCSPPGYSTHGILQARIPEWVIIPFSGWSSRPRDWTRSPALQADSLPPELQGKPLASISKELFTNGFKKALVKNSYSTWIKKKKIYSHYVFLTKYTILKSQNLRMASSAIVFELVILSDQLSSFSKCEY